MDELPEVIFVAGKNISVYDTATGNLIAWYKENKILPKTLALIKEDYLIGGLKNEPRVKVWTVSKWKNPKFGIFTLRGIVNALAVSSCGTYCVAGIKEEMHIWKVSSGELLNVVPRHYQDISCLRFSSDDSHILSGGKDGYVIVWILAHVVNIQVDRDQVKPRHVWNHHSSEVTDIFPGSLGCVARVATTSLDMTCKIYELDSGLLLSTICLDIPLTSVVMDTLESHVFLGASNGYLFKINIYDSLPKEFHFADMKNIQFKAHNQNIISLSMSMDGGKLMSASDDNTCRLWSIKSMTCLINLNVDGGITNAFLAMKPSALPSYDDVEPSFAVRPFKREFESSRKEGEPPTVTDSIITSKPENHAKLTSPEQFYSDMLCGASKVRKDALKKPEEKYFEDIFQESLHGGTINELKAINNQLYSYLINHSLDNKTEDSSS